MRMTEAQKAFMQRAATGSGTRAFTGREAYTAEILIRRGLMNTIPSNGPLFYLTPAGRRTLEGKR